MRDGWTGIETDTPLVGFPMGPVVKKKTKHPPAKPQDARDGSSTPGWEDPLEEDKAAHSSILAWRIPSTEEPGRLQNIGFQRIGNN